MKSNDKDKLSTFMIYVDANNFGGRATIQCLSTCVFRQLIQDKVKFGQLNIQVGMKLKKYIESWCLN